MTDESWEQYVLASNKIDVKVDEAIKKDKQKGYHVHYSAYKTDKNDNPIDNLNRRAVKGRVILIAPSTGFYGGSRSRPFKSKILENPTWLDIAVQANRMITTTKDFHHVFLEGVAKATVKIKDVPEDVKVYEFSMGS